MVFDRSHLGRERHVPERAQRRVLHQADGVPEILHLAEEQARPIGFLMASHAEEAIAYDGGEEA